MTTRHLNGTVLNLLKNPNFKISIILRACLFFFKEKNLINFKFDFPLPLEFLLHFLSSSAVRINSVMQNIHYIKAGWTNSSLIYHLINYFISVPNCHIPISLIKIKNIPCPFLCVSSFPNFLWCQYLQIYYDNLVCYI